MLSITKNIAFYILLLYATITPFVYSSSGANPFEFPKFILTIIVAQILAVFLLFNRHDFRIDFLTKLIFIFMLIVFISNMFGSDPRISLFGSSWRYQGFLLLISGLIFYLTARQIKRPDFIEKGIIISALGLLIISVIQNLMLNIGTNITNYNGRIIATLGNPNFLGAYLVITLPFILFSNIKLYLKIILSGLIFIGIFLSESRSALIAFFVLVLIYIFNKVEIKGIYKVLIAIALISTLFIVINNFSIFERTSIWDNRSIIWQNGIDAIPTSPFIGIGQENFETIFPKNLNFYVDNAHNIFIEIALSSGAIGLILFILILYKGFKRSEMKYKSFLISFLIIGFFNPLFISGIILFWIVLGLANNKSQLK